MIDSDIAADGIDHGFARAVRVSYGDCDMQGAVFNATYFAYIDDAIDVWLQDTTSGCRTRRLAAGHDVWLQDTLGQGYLDRFEYVVKRAAVEWAAAAGPRDLLALRPRVTRSGATSFDVTVTVDTDDTDDRHVAEATRTLISIRPGERVPVPVPVWRALDPTPMG